MSLRSKRFLFLLLALVLGAGRGLCSDSGQAIRFNHDIRPILSENCLLCHGPDKNRRKAKLRLDVREVALDLKAIVPGKPEASLLVQHIYATNADDLMPPPDTHKSLTAAEKETLKEWIAQGAQYEAHWAYIKPVRPGIPVVKDSGFVSDPIDAFILSALEARHIEPSPQADKRTLLRRLSLDLTGLPPSPEEVSAFLEDESSNAYERQVDRLLASPHYGERMAVPWLDAVRFADSVGYHGDQLQRDFPYRDYVIDSFNANKPFDQFTIEQIAGDLLPHATDEQKVATGYNRLNMKTREGGAQPREYLAKYAADRVRTLAGTWLGSTMGCCECHDHKYDPFSTKDFYQMEAFFADIQEWGCYRIYFDEEDAPELRGFDNDSPFPPEIQVPNRYLQQRLSRLKGELDDRITHASVKWKADAKEKIAFAQWRRESAAFVDGHKDGWLTPPPAVILVSTNRSSLADTNFVVRPDHSIVFVGKTGDTEVALPLTSNWLAAIRVELIPVSSATNRVLREKVETTEIAFDTSLKRSGQAVVQPLEYSVSDADHKVDRYFNGESLPGVNQGWKIAAGDASNYQSAVWLLKQPVHVSDGDSLVLRFHEHQAACLRISISPFAGTSPMLAGADEKLRRALHSSSFLRGAAKEGALEKAFFLDAGWSSDLAAVQKLQDDVQACNRGLASTMVTVAVKPRQMRVLTRGNWQDDKGEIVEPGVPHFLPQIPNPEGRRLTRLDLAQWLVSRDNPLTARAVVNRFWKQFFGTGLSAVVDDLGTQGEWPSHPELLDWLAVEFEESGWDVKHIVKLIVLSSTYRQQAGLRPEMRETDPNNRLLSCQSPRRLDAEFVRDNALAIAGLLNPDLGGPSFYPYQPAGYYANLQFPDRGYIADAGELQYRRGIYSHWQRTFLQPALANFDAPSREECTCVRNVSNTPQQALTLLNDPTFVEAAKALAHILLARPGSDEERLESASERALARPLKPQELDSLRQFLAKQRADNSNTELMAWTSVCRVILNLHETITVY
jgi:Protein of unknown function (DUF1553)/Protein of unknown function (DUF1549)/Planctomycete cytochrome C